MHIHIFPLLLFFVIACSLKPSSVGASTVPMTSAQRLDYEDKSEARHLNDPNDRTLSELQKGQNGRENVNDIAHGRDDQNHKNLKQYKQDKRRDYAGNEDADEREKAAFRWGGGVFGEDTEEDAEEDTEEEVIGAEEAEKVLREEVGAKGGRGHGGGGYGNRCKRKHRRGYGGGGYGGGY
jgi:hypothetical protein